MDEFNNTSAEEIYVLLRVDVGERLKSDEFDDSSWTRNELAALAWETLMRDHEDEWPEYNEALTPFTGVTHERA